ncbi:MAG TPA: hypothetical protein VHI13_15170 [Candidatus Kapabacteria bacterium]|nr:hypothetical protein [Candidatus Kapabacteria bacterium]
MNGTAGGADPVGERGGGYDCRLIWNAAWGAVPTFPRAVLDAPGGTEQNPYEPRDLLPDDWREQAHRAVLPPLSVLAGRAWQLTYDQLLEVIEHLYCCLRARRSADAGRRNAVQPGDRSGGNAYGAAKALPKPQRTGATHDPDGRSDSQHGSIEERLRGIGARLRRLL